MLSRIAESLFWIGRYTERADGTARIVDVLRLQLLEDPGADEVTASRTVLSVIMGMPFEGDPSKPGAKPALKPVAQVDGAPAPLAANSAGNSAGK